MNKYNYILISILILFLSGCVATEGKTVYYSNRSNDTITLYNDNTLTDGDSNSSISGVYRIDGDYVVMTFPPFGTVVKLKISGNTLIDEKDGETWVRQ